ncbi:MAG: hypothetical protein IAI50_02690, partial [Candidatus Eremiobacteraeota bacterium]|nr:hypothetical protein [Candidatus Eremiobacteraeota bacterium]
LRTYANRYGIATFFVGGVGWLTAVEESQLADVPPWIVGARADWFSILDGAAQQSAAIFGPKDAAYVSAIATVRETLTRFRATSPRDRKKASELCNDVLAEEIVGPLADAAGAKQIRLTGRGGSGKTTTLALLAKRLALINGERVLVLTFHKTLRGDIAHLLRSIVDVPGIVGRKIVVETVVDFFETALVALGAAVPCNDDGTRDFARFDAVLDETRALLYELPDGSGDIANLKARDPDRFRWDYVFVDEAQDWTDAERDFLRALYGSERLVLADGLEQLIRRQTPCDWTSDVAKERRLERHLGRSLRMTSNLALFANAFARASGLVDWQIAPYEKLPGGRIVIVTGAEPSTAAFVHALRDAAALGGAEPIDALICVPPRASGSSGEPPIVRALEAAGERVWNACDPRVRDTVPGDMQAWRVVRYDSCRGLEGWVTVALGLDDLDAVRRKYPNLAPGEIESPENVARRWLMIALTRAVHTLVIGVRDERAPIVATLRDAASRMPDGVIEWTTAAECHRVLMPRVDRKGFSY